MKTQIVLRKHAIALYLQGWNKSEIARKLKRSRRWVQRWIGRYTCTAPNAVRGKCEAEARDLHLVMGPAAPGTSVRFRVLIDGQTPGAAHGVDVDEQGNGMVTEQRLYQLIRQPKPIAVRQFEIEILDAGVEAYAFTFG